MLLVAVGTSRDSHVAQPLVLALVVLAKIRIYKICVDQGFKRGGYYLMDMTVLLDIMTMKWIISINM